ncbi:MAG: diguanylate cyclase [Clostridia bacterium]|nr:diguanylate cyclase [Clostridia bacterium]MDD4048723.1 diguanylate cyclase [Clostridia bacterium]
MKVLIAEDSKYYQRILQTTLEGWGLEVELACNGEQAWKILQREDGPKLAIVDWVMPKMTGIEVCERVRERLNESYIYIILLTSNSGKDDVIRGLEAGADDYIIKPFNELEFKFRIKNGKRIIDLENRIMQLALTDYLTGLLNRRAYIERVEAELERNLQAGQPVSLIMLDIDNFKKFNDNFGHLIGDKVLQNVANQLGIGVRKQDFIGRYGGEEFSVCLPEIDSKQASIIAERLRMGIKSIVLKDSDGNLIPYITASFGVSSTVGEGNSTVERLIKTADDALYIAKGSGKNRVVISRAEE